MVLSMMIELFLSRRLTLSRSTTILTLARSSSTPPVRLKTTFKSRTASEGGSDHYGLPDMSSRESAYVSAQVRMATNSKWFGHPAVAAAEKDSGQGLTGIFDGQHDVKVRLEKSLSKLCQLFRFFEIYFVIMS